MQNEDYDNLQKYIDELSKINQIETTVFCQNSLANIILSYYKNLAETKNIPMDILAAIPQNIMLEDTELWVLLGNLLENSIEGSLRIKDEKRQIKGRIKVDDDIMAIAVDNIVDENTINIVGEKFLSSKNNESCGNGIESVKKLAQKYNGSASFSIKDGWFQSSVYLKINHEKNSC